MNFTASKGSESSFFPSDCNTQHGQQGHMGRGIHDNELEERYNKRRQGPQPQSSTSNITNLPPFRADAEDKLHEESAMAIEEALRRGKGVRK